MVKCISFAQRGRTVHRWVVQSLESNLFLGRILSHDCEGCEMHRFDLPDTIVVLGKEHLIFLPSGLKCVWEDLENKGHEDQESEIHD